MTAGSEFLAFVENAIAIDAEDGLNLIERRPEALLQRKEALYARLADAWHGTELSRLRDDVRPGETWPVLSAHSQDVVSAAKDLYLPTAVGRRSPLEVAETSVQSTKTLLLYADGLLFPNPFRSLEYSFGDERAGDVPSDYAFLVALARIFRVSRLLRADVIQVGEADEPAFAAGVLFESESQFGELAAQFGRNLFLQGIHNDFNQWLLRGAGNLLVERVLWQLFYNAANLAGAGDATLLFESELDRTAAEAVIQTLPASTASSVSEADRLALVQLLALQLPGVAGVELRDIVHIRDDETFGIFRTDMSDALRDAASPLEELDLASAQRTVADHMAGGLERMKARTRRGVLADSVAGDTVGWFVGAALAGSVAGLRGVLATLVGKGVTDLAQASPTRSERALRAHYVALSLRPDHVRGQLDFADPGDSIAKRTNDVAESSAADILELFDEFDQRS